MGGSRAGSRELVPRIPLPPRGRALVRGRVPGSVLSGRESLLRPALRAAAAVLLVLLGGCGPEAVRDTREPAAFADGASVIAVDDAGRTVSLAAPARRIVSLLPATTETLVALGAAGRLVARTDYDEDPAVAHLPSVGGGLTPNVERIASLRPDLVVAWEEAGSARVRPRLEALGIPVFAVRTQDTTGIFANIERLGRLAGLDAVADSLAAAVRGDLEDVRTSVAGRAPRRALYLIGLDPPIVAGPHVFIGEMLEVAGGVNVFADVAAPSPQVSMEEIVRRRPEVVILASAERVETVEARLRATPGWRELLAGGTQVRVVPPDVTHRPGPAIVLAARHLRDALAPDTPPDR